MLLLLLITCILCLAALFEAPVCASHSIPTPLVCPAGVPLPDMPVLRRTEAYEAAIVYFHLSLWEALPLTEGVRTRGLWLLHVTARLNEDVEVAGRVVIVKILESLAKTEYLLFFS